MIDFKAITETLKKKGAESEREELYDEVQREGVGLRGTRLSVARNYAETLIAHLIDQYRSGKVEKVEDNYRHDLARRVAEILNNGKPKPIKTPAPPPTTETGSKELRGQGRMPLPEALKRLEGLLCTRGNLLVACDREHYSAIYGEFCATSDSLENALVDLAGKIGRKKRSG